MASYRDPGVGVQESRAPVGRAEAAEGCGGLQST